MTTSTKRPDESAYRELERLGFSVDGWISGTRIKTASIVSAVLSTNESPTPHPPVEGLREALEREEKYLIGHIDAECGIMPGDIEGSFHRIRALLSAQPAKGER